jgi:enediyne biosynthesis protein E4
MRSHRPRPRVCLVFLLWLGCLPGCGRPGTPGGGAGQPSDGTAWFEEVAAAAGIDFVHVRSAELRYWIPETVVGGAAWLDFDGDGLLDAYLVQGGDPLPGFKQGVSNRLYRNTGGGVAGGLNGTFQDVTDAAGVAGEGYGFGCATGDYDGDGHVDLYVCNLERNLLFRNRGDGTFEEVAREARVAEERWSAAALFTDYDRDGDLDLLVVQYLNWAPERELPCLSSYGERSYCNPINYSAPTTDTLYRNQGDGTFKDVSRESGFIQAAGTGLGCVAADFDGDGWVDLYVTNDGMPNHLWINQRDGTFSERALLAGCAVSGSGKAEAGMGVQAMDINGDGHWDLYMTHVREQTNTFYLNNGKGFFSDRTEVTGLGRPSIVFTGFGLGFQDFDLDGHLDLFVANGRVGHWRPALSEEDPFAEPNQVFRGLGAGRFEELSGWLAGGELLGTSRAAALADYDNDGSIDILYTDTHAPARLLRNIAPRRGNWIGFSPLFAHGSPALGAELRVHAGTRTWHRLCHSAYSYAAANDPRVHVGLGPVERVDAVDVLWPDGTRESFGPFEGGRYHPLRPGQGRPAPQ